MGNTDFILEKEIQEEIIKITSKDLYNKIREEFKNVEEQIIIDSPYYGKVNFKFVYFIDLRNKNVNEENKNIFKESEEIYSFKDNKASKAVVLKEWEEKTNEFQKKFDGEVVAIYMPTPEINEDWNANESPSEACKNEYVLKNGISMKFPIAVYQKYIDKFLNKNEQYFKKFI